MKKNMCEGKILPLIICFAIPILFGNLFQQLYAVVDTIIVGRYISTSALASVGATGSIGYLIIGFTFGLSSGFSIVMSQKIGAKDYHGLRKALAHSIICIIVIGLFITVLSLHYIENILEMLKTPSEIIDGSYIYMSIILKGLPFILMYNFEAAILRALGDSKTPFFFLIVSCLLNIVGDLLLVVVFEMGIEGVAYATVFSNLFVAVISFVYIFLKYPELKLSKDDFLFDSKIMKVLLSLGFPSALQNSVTAIGCMILQLQINKLGGIAVAGYTVGVKLEGLFCAVFMAIAVTMTTFSGQNFGANRFDRIKKGLRISLTINIIWAIITFIFLQLFNKKIVMFMVGSNDIEVIKKACEYLFATSILYIPLSVANIYNCTLQGLGKGYFTMLTSIQGLATRYIGAMILPPLFGYLGACFSGSISWITSAIMVIIGYNVLITRKVNIPPNENSNIPLE